MQALILAAGMGKRLGKYTNNATKCMVPVNGKTLIEYSIEAIMAAGIKKLVLVTGYKGEKLRSFVDGKKFGIEIEYVENPVYDKTNNIYSLYLALDKLLEDDTVLLESDLIFDKQVLKDLVETPDKNLAVVSPFESWMDGTCTLLNEKNEIISILDKAKFNWQNTTGYYKTVNIYKFSREFSRNYYAPFLKAYQQAFGKNEYYEQELKVISFLDCTSLKGFPVDGTKWYEIDDPADLAIAETRFANPQQKLSLLQKTYGGYWRYPSMLDYCYLVNPYFPPKKMVDELTSNFATLLTQYPSDQAQQSLLAGKIFGVEQDCIAVGNGAAELIKALGQKITGKIAVSRPTFNEYPERFGDAEVVDGPVKKDFSYTADDILETVKKENCNAVLLINPDNPSGNFIGKNDVLNLLDELKKMNITLYFDESFIDFAEKENRYTMIKQDILEKYPNLVVIKSISKSYGVPALRLGVLASSNRDYIKWIKNEVAIWNINSFAENFLQIYDKYKSSYAAACDKIAEERSRFVNELNKIEKLYVFPSKANFVLCEVKDFSAKKLAEVLLSKYNIFIKELSNKKGLSQGQYIRLAVRNIEDNNRLIAALKTELV